MISHSEQPCSRHLNLKDKGYKDLGTYHAVTGGNLGHPTLVSASKLWQDSELENFIFLV